MFDSTAIRERTARIAAALPALEWITDNRVERLSLDFFWFSPVPPSLNGAHACIGSLTFKRTSPPKIQVGLL